MKIILLLLVLVCYSFAQECSNLGNCTSCSSNTSCGWCSPTQQCLEGTQTGPKAGYCLGTSWQYGPGRCAKCEAMKDCRQCLENKADCGWCASNLECQPLNYFKQIGGCVPAAACACSVYKSCDLCLEGSNCQWCEQEGLCSDASLTCNGPFFNKTVGCPCTVYGDCPSCGNAYSCQWCDNTKKCEPAGKNGTGCLVASVSCNAFCASAGPTCSSCNGLNGCGWCGGTTQKCVDIESNTCNGFLEHSCPVCDQHNYCNPCLDDPLCNWCQSTGKCINKQGSPTCAKLSGSCTDWCNYLKSCSDCNEAEGCGWCSANGVCINVISKSSTCPGLWVHSCEPIPSSHCAFDGGAFVGGMFLVIGLLVLGALAYIVYRWKTGRKILYTELR